MITQKFPPSLLKYLKIYQENPSSRIFAPLAESYRKTGLIDEAIEICKEGLVFNPDFTGGKVALARAYYDKKQYRLVRDLLLPFIEKIPDNLIAQRLLADSCLALGYVKDALTAYKMLLYFNPHDHEVNALVQELETKSFEQGGGILQTHLSPEKLRKLMKLQKTLERIREMGAS